MKKTKRKTLKHKKKPSLNKSSISKKHHSKLNPKIDKKNKKSPSNKTNKTSSNKFGLVSKSEVLKKKPYLKKKKKKVIDIKVPVIK